MTAVKRASWGEGQFYEALCLLMIGTCFWLIGVQFTAFDALVSAHPVLRVWP